MSGRPRRRGRLAAARRTLASTLLCVGCATPVVHEHPEALRERGELAFLREGSTTRAEACLRLGPPTGAYERERILAWALVRRADGTFAPTRAERSRQGRIAWQASLVLVFAEDGVLARGSLVVAE
jgi:hypothetical protein